MKPKNFYAHKLVEQFVEWNKTGIDGCRSYPSAVPFINLLYRGNEEKQTLKSYLEPWFTDEIATIVNELLSIFSERKPNDFKILMHYYFSNQSLMVTAKRYNMHRDKLKNVIFSSLAYIDGIIDSERKFSKWLKHIS